MIETQTTNKKTLVLHPSLKLGRHTADAKSGLDEAIGLAHAIDLDIVSADIVPLASVVPKTYLGSGKVDEYKAIINGLEVGLVIMDCKVTPIQQRNLETAWNCKVIDRTALILEIFGQRARTGEGKLQVDLAALEYQKSRLVRSWTHLERQRGGFGFMGGPGEKQIESDRRVIGDQITKIKEDLETVKRTRKLHRESRRTVPYPIVALVGYTNAGKSTLFNRLTGANVLAEDKLFATLDPTMRMVTLPSKRKIILSDTVGFISDLPTELIAAFRATLEEVTGADVLLHVRDIAHPHTAQQKKDVLNVLKNLGLEPELDEKMIEVLNKVDLMPENALDTDKEDKRFAISAISGEGIDQMLRRIEQMLGKDDNHIMVTLPSEEGKLLAWIYDHSEVIERRDMEETITVALRISEKDHTKLQKLCAETAGKIKVRQE